MKSLEEWKDFKQKQILKLDKELIRVSSKISTIQQELENTDFFYNEYSIRAGKNQKNRDTKKIQNDTQKIPKRNNELNENLETNETKSNDNISNGLFDLF